ncbi:uncharacterized protein LOC103315056 isoform X1 [Tribolium castaneum]|uniref:Uncharacterized protein n=1 Tax=Tribolium castaneum TaxID=7070 RepID=D6WD13_TRICA|nr:PREDICTED: uncharacterized protein LOC103315056 isoform X1 [Tribolium castaneum]EEZ99091.2 hypothetical protein TcasGA2_TC004974 [Tribolium castaneum]|eukprot:XP_015839206.1 PREDICTED: uncharacterized protein LOC103315056 isoform X1 [Tribolium castaneum]
MACENLLGVVIVLIKIFGSFSQRLSYGEPCNFTEECSDHRYECLPAEEEILRCLCDRFHSWMGENVGCVQMFNASEIMNMTVTVTDNINQLEEQVEEVIKVQIAAGLFVFGMVIFASIAVTVFCIYVHVKDRKVGKTVSCKKKREGKSTLRVKPMPSTSLV